MTMRWVITLGAVGLVSTTGIRAEKIQLNAAPAAVQQAIQSQSGGAAIEDLDREVRNGKVVYEAAFKRNGAHTEIVVGEDGTLISPLPAGGAQSPLPSTPITLQNATKVAFTSLPAAVQQTVRTQAGTAPIEDVEIGTWAGRNVYQVAFKNQLNRHREIFVSQEGILLQPQPTPGSPVVGAPVATATPQIRPAGTPMRFSDAPQPVQTALSAYSAGARIQTIHKLNATNAEYYHAEVMRDGKPVDLRVDSKGLLVDERFRPTASGTLVRLSNARKIQVRRAPAEVQDAVRTQVGQAAVEDVDVGTWNGQTVYQVAFKNQDKHTEIQLLPDGKVLADQRMDRVNIGVGAAPAAAVGSTPISRPISPATTTEVVDPNSAEAKISYAQLPVVVQRAVRAHAGAAQIEDVDRKVKDGKVYYEVGYKVNDIHTELEIDTDGKVVKK